MKVTKLLAAAVAAVAATSAVAATAGAYNGYINWQSSAYSFRNDWNEPSYGAATPYFNSAIVWGSGDAPEETYPDYADNFDWDINGYVLDANYTQTAQSTAMVHTQYPWTAMTGLLTAVQHSIWLA